MDERRLISNHVWPIFHPEEGGNAALETDMTREKSTNESRYAVVGDKESTQALSASTQDVYGNFNYCLI